MSFWPTEQPTAADFNLFLLPIMGYEPPRARYNLTLIEAIEADHEMSEESVILKVPHDVVRKAQRVFD